MTPSRKDFLVLLSCILLGSIEAFMQLPLSHPTIKTTKLQGYIAADSTDEEVDWTLGGVGLAQNNAIVMIGKVDKKGEVTATDMTRYTELSTFDENNLGKKGISVVCKGEGIELYQDPGLGTQTTIVLAPLEAISNALDAVDKPVASKDAKKILINFAGGDDLMVHEVLEGVRRLSSSLSFPKDQAIEFRSLCHNSFPVEKCSVVVLSVAGGSGPVNENVYWHEGKWWTLLEENLNESVA